MLKELMEYDIEASTDLLKEFRNDETKDEYNNFANRILTANAIITKLRLNVSLDEHEKKFIEECVDMWIYDMIL